MNLNVTVEIPFPRERVYPTYRDKLPELVPYLPNVRSIQVVSRTVEGDVVKLVNRWKGGGDIPAVAHRFLADDLLEWDDHATWRAGPFTTHWAMVVGALKGVLVAQGVNRFEDVRGTHTRLAISGDIRVDATKIKGIPRLLGSTVGSAVEAFLIATIKPNLVAVSKGVEQYLRERGGNPRSCQPS